MSVTFESVRFGSVEIEEQQVVEASLRAESASAVIATR